MTLMEIIPSEATLQHQIIIISMIGIVMVALLTLVILTFKFLIKKNQLIKNLQEDHANKINNIQIEHAVVVEKLRSEMLKHEEERTRQWMESEKETLHVLSGISTLLELGDKIGRVESEKILANLNQIQIKIEKFITEYSNKK